MSPHVYVRVWSRFCVLCKIPHVHPSKEHHAFSEMVCVYLNFQCRNSVNGSKVFFLVLQPCELGCVRAGELLVLGTCSSVTQSSPLLNGDSPPSNVVVEVVELNTMDVLCN